MASIFGRLKSSNAPNGAPVGPSISKKNESQHPPTPLEQILADAGPLRNDGSDKFFGMHNPSNTCYCNSVVQCLYFSEPFREQVVNFPRQRRRDMPLRLTTNGAHSNTDANAANSLSPTPPTPAKPHSDGFFSLGQKKATTTQPSPTAPTSRPEDNKDSFDYQKKVAYASGPHLKMENAYFEAYGMPESLFTGLKDIFEAVIAHQSRTGVITPAKFLEVLRRNYELFRSPMHQDAHEFLNLLLNEVVDQVESYSKNSAQAVNPAKPVPQTKRISTDGTPPINNSSWVHELFEGTLTSETRCLTCENVSQRDEVFLDLSVDLEEHSSVTSCLRKFSAEEMLCERNKFHCDKCSGLQEAEKRMKIKRLPRILALHLKRFKYVEELGRLQKLFHRVVYPFHLRLFNTTDDAEDPDRLYELYAVIVHLGSTPFHGHYVSIIKTKDRGWLLFDDELVLPVDKNYVRNFFGGDPRNPACAYVLFYQQTTVEAVEREQEAEDSTANIPTTYENTAGLWLDTNVALSPTIASPEALVTPTSEEPGFATLEHAVTAPSWSPPIPQPQSTTDYVVTSPTEPLTSPDTKASDEERPPGADRSTAKENGRPAVLLKSSSSFNRFRNTSMSIRQKPKFWILKDRADAREDADGSPPGTGKEPERSQPESPAEKPEKSKGSRFGIGRKRSSMLF